MVKIASRRLTASLKLPKIFKFNAEQKLPQYAVFVVFLVIRLAHQVLNKFLKFFYEWKFRNVVKNRKSPLCILVNNRWCYCLLVFTTLGVFTDNAAGGYQFLQIIPADPSLINLKNLEYHVLKFWTSRNRIDDWSKFSHRVTW